MKIKLLYQRLQIVKKSIIHVAFVLLIANIAMANRNSESAFIDAENAIKGTVSDENGEKLPGVSVSLKGTSRGVTTNNNGEYSITVPDEKSTLIFSFVGFQTKEIVVENKTTINIALQVDNNALDEIVVVGYGEQKKSTLIGAVSQLKASDINNRSVTRLSSAIAGQLPGVTVIQRSGQPGVGNTIQIRGLGSFGASAAALIILDGIPVGNLDNIDPNDIENISILKDASTAAIYGARAANGVILVTTKTGKGDKLKVSYNAYVGTQRATEYPDFASSYEYAQAVNFALPNSYSDQDLLKFQDGSDPDRFPNINYVDLIFKKGTLQFGNSIAISNGNEKSNYNFSFGQLHQEGIIEKNKFDRYTLRFNFNTKVSSKFTLSTRLSAIQTNNNEPAPPFSLDFSSMSGIISNVVRTAAIFPAVLSNGDYGLGSFTKGTPVSFLNNASFYKSNNLNLIANFRGDYQVLKGLKLSLIGGITNFESKDKLFLSSQKLNPTITLGPGTLNQNSGNTVYSTFQQLAEYSTKIKEHGLSILAGHSFEYTIANSLSAFRGGYQSNDLTQINVGAADGQTNSGTANEWALDSYFTRLQYNYKEKYLLEGTVRVDGSSRFPKNKRYTTFPTMAIGWRLSEEDLIKDKAPWLNDLKIKASYGILGNQNIGNYPYQKILRSGYNYSFGGVVNTGLALETIADSTIQWESTRTYDVGLEGSLFKNKLSFGVTYFDRYTTDILVSPNASLSNVLGFNVGPQNSGKLKNRGFEFTLNHQNKIGNFKYGITSNFTVLNNEVIDLGVGNITQPNGLVGNGSSLFVGYPVNIYYGFQTDGVFLTKEEATAWANMSSIFGGTLNSNVQPGDIRYKDLSGPEGVPDGKVDNTYDRTVLGSTLPKYTFGMNISLSYKNFDFNTLLQGIAGVKGQLTSYAGFALFNAGNVQKWQLEEGWNKNPTNRYATYPRMEQISNSGTGNTQTSDFWAIDGSYLRIKNIQLGYTLPKSLLKKAKISNLRIYSSAENLFTFKNYRKGWDPEINTDGAYYPILANFTFGINLEL